MTMSGPLSEAIGLAVLHLLWQGVLVAAVLAILLRLLRAASANVRYALSCAALTALVLFGVVTAIQKYEGIEPDAQAMGNAVEIAVAPLPVEEVEEGSLAAQFAAFVHIHSSTIALVWLLGVALLASRLAVSWTRTRGLVTASARPAPDEWQRVAARLSSALGLRRVVRLVESAAVDVPSVVGFLKPVILVPASSLAGLSTRQLEMILAHELAHITRHDFLVNMFQSVAETLLFYHPAAWWISRQIRIERENCCDDLAVATCGNAVEYARALTILEELREGPALALAANGGSLLDRVRRLIGAREKTMGNGWTAVAAAVSFAVIMTVTSLPLQADRDVPEPPEAPNAVLDVIAPPPPPPAPAAPEPGVPATPEAPEAPEPPEIAFTPAIAPLADDFDFDFDVDVDIEPPSIPEPPVIAFGTPVAVAAPAVRPLRAVQIGKSARLLTLDEGKSDKPMSSSGPLTVDELIALRIHNVTPEYINEMRGIFGTLTLRQVTQMKTMNVTTKYLADIRAAGVNVTTPREAIQLRTYNVTPEFVRSLSAAGYTKLSVRDLTRLANAGVNADFIRDMSKYREKK